MEKEILNESKLIEIKKAPKQNKFATGQAKKIIFVGDTHGDLEASQKVIKDYLKPDNKIVFLGDYVDRGPHSKENLDFLLETKNKHRDQIYLLQGNHEGHHILSFSPADFWESLNAKDYEKYSQIVENFPLVIVTKDIIALHGALPDVKDLKEINNIRMGAFGFREPKASERYSNAWWQICWGDFVEEKGEYLGPDIFTGRPKFGRDYFLKLMERFQKKVLIRSHQPDAPLFIFDDRCLTIFTSSAYTSERTIAIADLSKEIKTAKDLEIKRI